MAKGDIIAKLLLNDKDYTTKLDKARKSSKAFQDKISSGVTSAISKMAVQLGVAGGAFKTLSTVIQSSQTSSDAFARVMRQAKDSVDNLFTAMATGDFTPFALGLDEIRQKAKDTADALDQLSNTQMSYDYFTSKNQAKFAELLEKARDTSLSEEERKKASEAMMGLDGHGGVMGDQEKITAAYETQIKRVISDLMTRKNLLSSDAVGLINLDDVMRVDVMEKPEEIRAAAKARYKEYKKAIKEAESKYTSQYTVNGNVIKTVDPRYKDEVNRLTEAYKDDILIVSLLEKESDSFVQELITLSQKLDSSNKLIADWGKQANKTRDAVDKLTTSTGNLTYGVTHQAQAVEYLSGGEGVNWGTFVEENKDDLHKSFTANEPPKINLSLPNAQPYVDSMAEAQSSTEGTQMAVSSLASTMSSLSGVLNDSAAGWVNWGANVLQAVATAVPALAEVAAAQKAAANANAEAATTGAAAAVAAVPLAGPALALASIASIIAAFAAIPKFADGGIIGGSSYSGDKLLARVNSGEMVLNTDQQRILSSRLDSGFAGQVEFKIKDRQLVGILENYNRLHARGV